MQAKAILGWKYIMSHQPNLCTVSQPLMQWSQIREAWGPFWHLLVTHILWSLTSFKHTMLSSCTQIIIIQYSCNGLLSCIPFTYSTVLLIIHKILTPHPSTNHLAEYIIPHLYNTHNCPHSSNISPHFNNTLYFHGWGKGQREREREKWKLTRDIDR